MRRTTQRIALGACLAAALSASLIRAADTEAAKPDAPAKAADAAPAKRTTAQIMAEIQKANQGLSESLQSANTLIDPEKRKAAAPKVIPAAKKMIGLLKEAKDSGDPQGAAIAERALPQLDMILVAFGDEETTKALEATAKGTDKADALKAQTSLLTGRWLSCNKDVAEQEKLADKAEKLAKENPASDDVTGMLMTMSQMGASSSKLTDRLQNAAVAMDTDSAKQIKEQVEGERKLRSLESKPLVIAGVRNDGSQFTTADWKGKVILVDFWATWCGPCRAELPRVKKAYADFHSKGLEVLGVSCDNDGGDLDKFLKENKDMPWPQLFDAKTPGWHPLAKSYGINGIPTMFLIDKNGVVRTVTARENFEELIPKMLAEKTAS